MKPMRFKLFGTEIYISFLFAALVTAMIAFDRTGYAFPLLFAVIMHEAGHLCAMWITDSSPKRIRLVPASVEITSKIEFSRKNEAFTAFCGPAVNIVLFLTFWINYAVFHKEMSLICGIINLLIGLFNLLPLVGLDGGTILFNRLCRKKDESKACLIMRIINIAFASMLIFIAVCLCFKGKINITLFIMGLYLIIIALIKI